MFAKTLLSSGPENIGDPNSPLNPFNPVSPLHPMNPISPLNSDKLTNLPKAPPQSDLPNIINNPIFYGSGGALLGRLMSVPHPNLGQTVPLKSILKNGIKGSLVLSLIIETTDQILMIVDHGKNPQAALVDASVDIGLGAVSGAAGAFLGARIGMAIGSGGGPFGFVAGMLLGGLVGWGLEEAKQEFFS